MKILSIVFLTMLISTLEPISDIEGWCSCIEESEGSDMDCELCDRKHDPLKTLDWQRDCQDIEDNERV